MFASSSPAPSAEPRGLLGRLFGLDVRSLALVRVALGVIVLVDLALRSGDLVTFYGDDGVLPRAAWLRAYPGSFSLHAASGSPLYLGLLFALEALAACCLVLGFRTRLATFVTWLLVTSLHARNPTLLQGGDALLGLLLFWGLFVPLGATFSVDAALSPAVPTAPRRVLGLGTVAIALQMPFVYFFTGLLKGGPEWHSTFTAIEGALRDDFVSSPTGRWLADVIPGPVLSGMTASVLVVEIGIPLLLLCPFRTERVRLYLLPSLFLLQAGFLACLRIGLFPFISTTGAVVLLPSLFWDHLGAALSPRAFSARLLGTLRPLGRVLVSALHPLGGATPRFRLGPVSAVFVAAALTFALADNVALVAHEKMPRVVADTGHALRLRQSWKLFVRSSKSHRWAVVVGKRADGTEVDLLAGDGRAPSFERPTHISDGFESYRWRKYVTALMGKGKKGKAVRQALASHLCHAGADGSPLVAVRAYRFDEPVGHEGESPKRRLLFTKRCGAHGAGERVSRAE